jgi:hypothetical protein
MFLAARRFRRAGAGLPASAGVLRQACFGEPGFGRSGFGKSGFGKSGFGRSSFG